MDDSTADAVPDGYLAHQFTVAEAALRSMREHRVAPESEYFAVWLAHHAGHNPALSRMLRVLLDSREPLDAARHQELYERFIARGRHALAECQSLTRADSIMALLTGQLDQHQRSTRSYGASLESAAATLASPGQIEAFGQVVAALRRETRAMASRSDGLQAELEQHKREIGMLRATLQDVQRTIELDPLTGIGNRRQFDRALREAALQAMEAGTALSLLLLDIDHFKRFNDTHGHQIGDVVLQLVAGRLRALVREADVPARYGGEEFVIVLPGIELGGAVQTAELIRQDVAGKRIQLKARGEDLGGITLSAGAASYRPGESLPLLVERTDQALYAAKRDGRNRTAARP